MLFVHDAIQKEEVKKEEETKETQETKCEVKISSP
jgi:hypothetical protein